MSKKPTLKSKYDIDFVVIVVVYVVIVTLMAFVSRALNISFFFLFMSAAVIGWLIMHFYEKNWLSDLREEPSVIYCEWENKLNLTDFSVSNTTKSDLEELDFTLETAMGAVFVFRTEPSQKHSDYYFEGTIIKGDGGSYLIRSSEEIHTELVALKN